MQTTRLKLLARTYLTFNGRLDFLPDKLQPVVLASRSFVVGQEITEIDARLPAPTSTNTSLTDTDGVLLCGYFCFSYSRRWKTRRRRAKNLLRCGEEK